MPSWAAYKLMIQLVSDNAYPVAQWQLSCVKQVWRCTELPAAVEQGTCCIILRRVWSLACRALFALLWPKACGAEPVRARLLRVSHA